MAKINRKQLLIELSASEKILVKEAERIATKNFFLPAVQKMKEDFDSHLVTKEIEGGIDSENISQTLGGGSKKNLYSFIGFDIGTDPIKPLRETLDPSHVDGPKIKYIRGSNNQNLDFKFVISAPNYENIKKETPMPWAKGISWVNRIERGIPGLGFFLNKLGIKQSRSGGGIQIENKVRDGRFKNTSYLSGIFNRFLGYFK